MRRALSVHILALAISAGAPAYAQQSGAEPSPAQIKVAAEAFDRGREAYKAEEYVEAASIDGANSWQIFRRITLPLLGPTIRLSVFFAIIGSIQLFDIIMPLTKGGPSDSTQTMVTFLYSYGVTRMQIGFGSAVGVVLFLICVAFAFGYKRTLMRDD